MDNPFSADKNNPFQTPYQQPTPAAASSIKPFTAVDSAPPAGQNGNRHSAPPAPAPNPFLGGDYGGAFMNREAPDGGAMQTMPPAAPPANNFAPQPAMPAPHNFAAQPAVPAQNNYATQPPVAVPHAFAPQPAMPSPMPDYSPVPMAPPAAARQSQILSMTDFNESMNARKPAFFCTSTPNIDGYQIQSYLGVVSVEIVIPKDILFHNPAAYGELHRMKSAEEQLQKVKGKAFEELSERARALQADGLVGVTLQFSQFDAIVCLCSAVGTAVKLAD